MRKEKRYVLNMSSVLNWFRKLDLFNGEFFSEEVLAGTAIPGGEERGRVAGGWGGGDIPDAALSPPE